MASKTAKSSAEKKTASKKGNHDDSPITTKLKAKTVSATGKSQKKLTASSVEPMKKMQPSSAEVTVQTLSNSQIQTNDVVVMKQKTKDFTGIGYLDIPPYQEKKDEEYMNSEQRDHFKQILNAWKRSLMEEVDRTVSHMKDEAANFPDLNDRASQEEEFSLELRARDRERKLIRKIDEALQRLEADDYGFCDACGIEIGIRRLEARPTATLCIDCKTLEEIKEKQYNS